MFSKATDTYLAKGGENQYPLNQKLFRLEEHFWSSKLVDPKM